MNKDLTEAYPDTFNYNADVIDTSMYVKNKCLRILGCSKTGSKYKKVAIEDYGNDVFRPLVSKSCDMDGNMLVELGFFNTIKHLMDEIVPVESDNSFDIGQTEDSLITFIKEKCNQSNRSYLSHKQHGHLILVYLK